MKGDIGPVWKLLLKTFYVLLNIKQFSNSKNMFDKLLKKNSFLRICHKIGCFL